MNIGIEDYLQKIDNSFKDKSQKDIYMTYIMIFGIIFAFSYLLFWDTSEAEFKAKRAQVKNLETKIRNDNLFLQQNTLAKVSNIENEIQYALAQTITYKDNNQYIKHKIEDISFLIYDEQTWGEYLHSISKHAKANDVKILNFSNHYSESQESFGHVLDINIEFNAKYNNTLNFINSIEQSDLVVDLHKLSIAANKNLDTNLTISVWGITY